MLNYPFYFKNKYFEIKIEIQHQPTLILNYPFYFKNKYFEIKIEI
jgi:hypothetical protein